MSYNQKNVFILITSFKKLFHYWLNREEITFPFFKDYEKLRSSFLGSFFRVFCSGFISSSTHNHIPYMYPHVFPPHWVKGIWYNLFHPSLFCWINDSWNLGGGGLGGALWLKKVGGKDLWGVGDFPHPP